METRERPRRNTDTSAATRTNVERKHRRWAEELKAAGWTVTEPADPIRNRVEAMLQGEHGARS